MRLLTIMLIHRMTRSLQRANFPVCFFAALVNRFRSLGSLSFAPFATLTRECGERDETGRLADLTHEIDVRLRRLAYCRCRRKVPAMSLAIDLHLMQIRSQWPGRSVGA